MPPSQKYTFLASLSHPRAPYYFFIYQRYVSLASVDFYLSTFKTTNFVKAMEILRELRHRKIFLCQQHAFVA